MIITLLPYSIGKGEGIYVRKSAGWQKKKTGLSDRFSRREKYEKIYQIKTCLLNLWLYSTDIL